MISLIVKSINIKKETEQHNTARKLIEKGIRYVVTRGLEVVGWEMRKRDEGITEKPGGLRPKGSQRVGKTETT